MEKKMTYAQALEVAIAEVANEEVRERLVALKGTFDNKAANRKPTKTQKENEGVKETILATLKALNAPATVTEILANGNFDDTITNQKVSALLRQLKEEGKVVKTTDKKKSYFEVKGE